MWNTRLRKYDICGPSPLALGNMLKVFPIYISQGVLEVMRAKGGLQSPTEAHHAKQLFLISYLTRKILQEEDAKKRNGYINLNSADCKTAYDSE